MPDALTITREWFELLEGLPTVQSRWDVLYAVAGFAFDGREPGKEDLTAIEKSIFMNMRSKIQNRKRRCNHYSKHKDNRYNVTLQSDGDNISSNRYNVTLQCNGQKTTKNPSSNQHIDTSNIPFPSLSNDRVWFPHDEKVTARRVFKVPTLEEVKAYIRGKGYAVDAEEFYAYYSANGWIIGHGNKMRSWESAIAYWQRRMNQSNRMRAQKRDYSGI